MNEQVLRPQHLTQVGHEGNPVECFVVVAGTLDSPNPFDADGVDLGGPVLYPVTGSGGAGGSSSDTPVLPLNIVGTDMNCDQGSVSLSVTGGVGPYSWSTTLGNLSSATGSTTTLTPPTNNGPNVVGRAYAKVSKYLATCVIGGTTDCVQNSYNCDGSIALECSGVNTDPCQQYCDASAHCAGFYPGTPSPAFASPNASSCAAAKGLNVADTCTGPTAFTQCVCDLRTAQMITDGCNPCEISFANGAVITVTDGNGHQAFFGVARA